MYGPWFPGKRCEVCSQQFFSSSTFRKHRALHRGETKCPLCLRVYRQKSYLKTHMRMVHDLDCGFLCHLCQRHFTSYSSYYHHQQVHMGNTTCPICGKVFSQKGHLRVHLRTVHRCLV
ncbi:Zinc finger protein 764 [Amphibalanus amphitrite]|uniref:Zinc finger protein 764 n=1 Tax=Amphibalanus amphitrite TaxID=1232801 RepID=A0A6A4WRW3_AMPAM|nr:Zinc finger protein 764 [Amphibalanus amphitrite]